MIPLFIIYAIFFAVIIVIVYFSIKNILNLYEEVTYGAGLENKHFKYILIVHIFILIYSAILIAVYHFNKSNNLEFELKTFITNIIISLIGLFIVLILFWLLKFILIRYFQKIYITSYQDLKEDDETDETNYSSGEYDQHSAEQRFNRIIAAVIGQLFFIYILLFIFPVTGIQIENKILEPEKKFNIKRTIVDDAREKYGDNYLYELAKLRRNYIKKYGWKTWNELFEWQVKDIDFMKIDAQLEMEEYNKEMANIEKNYISDLEKINTDSSPLKNFSTGIHNETNAEETNVEQKNMR